MKLLLQFARAYPGRSALALLGLILAGVAEGIGVSSLLPLISTALDSRGNGSGDGGSEEDLAEQFISGLLGFFGLSPTIGSLLGVIVVGLCLKAALMLWAHRQVGYTVAFVATDLRLALFRALIGTRWEYFLGQPVGALANSVATEATRASQAYLFGANMMALLIQAIIYTVAALIISWEATLVAMALGSLLFVALYKLVRSARKAGRRQTQVLRSLLGHLTDSLQSIKPLKAMGREGMADSLLRSETRQLNRALRKEVLSKQALKALQEPMMGSIFAGGLYVALVHYDMALSTILVLTLLMARVLTQMTKVQQRYQDMIVCESAYWALQDTIAAASQARETLGGERPPVFERELRLDDVHFDYGGAPVLRGVDVVFPAGVMTALTGGSGGGKTTLVDLVIGLLRPQRGAVRVDGVPLSEIDLHAWREQIGYVPQDTFLMHDTVLANVTLGDPRLTEADAEKALRDAEVWEVIATLPEGLQTVVGERGSRFSGGQRQRIAIARALVHRPRLLILDEATSALDPQAERAICETMRHLRGRLTIIAVSHQEEMIAAADRVYRLQDGRAQLLRDDVVVEADSRPLPGRQTPSV